MATVTRTQPAYDLHALRQQFLPVQHGKIYLNHAGMSPLPTSTRDAMHEMTDLIATNAAGVFETHYEQLTEAVQAKIARLLNCQPQESAFVQNTSMGINMVAQSLPLKEGDNVILCDVEFPSNVYPWQNLARHKDVETRLVPAAEGGLSLDAVEQARDENTRVVAVSGVQFFSGRCEDLAAIGAYCHENGLWLIVDAIQAAGVVPIDVEAMHISTLVAGGQKALMAPPGQGIIMVREDVIEQMTPIFVGATSVTDWHDWLTYDLTPLEGTARFGMGTINMTGLAGLSASLDLLLDLGVEHIYEWVHHLSDVAIEDLTERGYDVVTPDRHAHIVTFAWPGDAEQAVAYLAERGIHLRAHMAPDGSPHLRISSHAYNTIEDVLSVGKALEEISS